MKNYSNQEVGIFISIMVVVSLFSSLFVSALVFNSFNQNSTNTADNYFELKALITGFEGVSDNIKGEINPELRLTSANSNVTIKLIAGEPVPHNFVVDKYQDNESLTTVSTQEPYPNEITVSFLVDTEGVFIYYCSFPGHFNSMHGKIITPNAQVSTPNPALPVTASSIVRNPTDIPAPVGIRPAQDVEFTIITKEVVAEIEPGTTLEYYTFNGTVPGPLIRVRVGDNVTIHLTNDPSSMHIHSIDLHAVTDNGGGAAYTQVAPGETKSFSFNASHVGVFIYHCASPHVPTHISLGMFGAISVEPVTGLPVVDKEFYVVQNEFYTKWPAGTSGNQVFDDQKLLNEEPTYVTFNGKAFGLTDPANSLNATQNDTIRLFFAVAGPNLASSFHIIGEVMDQIYYENSQSPNMIDAETVSVPPGSALMIQMNVEKVGRFLLVDHALSRAFDKGAIGYLYVNP